MLHHAEYFLKITLILLNMILEVKYKWALDLIILRIPAEYFWKYGRQKDGVCE